MFADTARQSSARKRTALAKARRALLDGLATFEVVDRAHWSVVPLDGSEALFVSDPNRDVRLFDRVAGWAGELEDRPSPTISDPLPGGMFTIDFHDGQEPLKVRGKDNAERLAEQGRPTL